MSDWISTTSKPMPNGGMSARPSSRMMQDSGASAWSPRPFSPNVREAWRSYAPAGASAQTMFCTDLSKFKHDRTSSVVSFVIHIVAIAACLTLAFNARRAISPEAPAIVNHVDFTLTDPPMPMPVAKVEGGGGGGGAHEKLPPPKGHLPKFVVAKTMIMPSQIVRIERPKLGLEPTEMVKMPTNMTLPNLGVTNSPRIALASQGSGSGSGFGMGMGAALAWGMVVEQAREVVAGMVAG